MRAQAEADDPDLARFFRVPSNGTVVVGFGFHGVMSERRHRRMNIRRLWNMKVGRFVAVAGLAAVVPFVGCACASTGGKIVSAPVAEPVRVSQDAASALPAPDPVELLRVALERCEREVRGYTCVFFKQERTGNELGLQQAMEVMYRDEPRSVRMTWVKNPDRLRRVLYVRGLNVSEKGEEQAVVEPAGAVARLFVKTLCIPIHGDRAQAASRHPIDQFGFHSTLGRLNEENAKLAAEGVLRWTYEGEGNVDGRATYVLKRHLPSDGAAGRYPNARLVVHLDKDWLAPVAVHAYADDAEQVLLGSYVTTAVKLNPGLHDAAFKL